MRSALRTVAFGAVLAVSLVLAPVVNGPPSQISRAAAQTELAPGGTFLDDDRTFAESSIEAVFAAGITNGCGPRLYCPRRHLTRAEAAVLVARALQLETAETDGFPDVPADAWYAEAVAALAANGILTGHSDGTFRPDDPLNRAQMAQLLVRALASTPVAEPLTTRFADVPAEALYAPAVEWLAEQGITLGCSTQILLFCPLDEVTRDQMAVFLTRGLGLTPLVPPERIAPLNGLPIDGLAWNRRPLAVKIDDHRGARPQSGVEEADAVYEILVEGGLTRWMAVFHQSDTPYLGPVRSIRPTDIGLALPLGATVVVSGGQPWILDQATTAGVNLLRERDIPGDAMFRISSRQAPHNVYVDTSALRAVADAAGHPDVPPPPLFTWGALPPGESATSIDLSWSDPITVTWKWDGQRYRRWREGNPHLWVKPDGSSGQVSADSLIVIRAPLSEQSPPPGVSGSPVPVLDTVGSGDVIVFAQGRAVVGRWSRTGLSDPFLLTTLDGSLLAIPPGIPWINVFPEGRTIGY